MERQFMTEIVWIKCKGNHIFWKSTLMLSNKCDPSVFNWHPPFCVLAFLLDWLLWVGIMQTFSVQVTFKQWKENGMHLKSPAGWNNHDQWIRQVSFILFFHEAQSYSRQLRVTTGFQLVSDTISLLIIKFFYHIKFTVHGGRWS